MPPSWSPESSRIEMKIALSTLFGRSRLLLAPGTVAGTLIAGCALSTAPATRIRLQVSERVSLQD